MMHHLLKSSCWFKEFALLSFEFHTKGPSGHLASRVFSSFTVYRFYGLRYQVCGLRFTVYETVIGSWFFISTHSVCSADTDSRSFSVVCVVESQVSTWFPEIWASPNNFLSRERPTVPCNVMRLPGISREISCSRIRIVNIPMRKVSWKDHPYFLCILDLHSSCTHFFTWLVHSSCILSVEWGGWLSLQIISLLRIR